MSRNTESGILHMNWHSPKRAWEVEAEAQRLHQWEAGVVLEKVNSLESIEKAGQWISSHQREGQSAWPSAPPDG